MCPETLNKMNYWLLNGPTLEIPGRIVQIDESLFVHKAKYHRGRYQDQQVLVFGLSDVSF
jgi:hypothetical protein